jgi:hypothetical protein
VQCDFWPSPIRGPHIIPTHRAPGAHVAPEAASWSCGASHLRRVSNRAGNFALLSGGDRSGKWGRMAKTVESEFYRRRRNFVVEAVRDAFPGIHVRDAWARRSGRGRWEFHYRTFLWAGQAAGANDATAKGWTAFLSEQGVAAYARRVNVPAQFAFVA